MKVHSFLVLLLHDFVQISLQQCMVFYKFSPEKLLLHSNSGACGSIDRVRKKRPSSVKMAYKGTDRAGRR
jgi:hypothetical protein